MHRNARLTVWGRQELVRRVEAGTPATVASKMSPSRWPSWYMAITFCSTSAAISRAMAGHYDQAP
jgi:hypothetical protein